MSSQARHRVAFVTALLAALVGCGSNQPTPRPAAPTTPEAAPNTTNVAAASAAPAPEPALAPSSSAPAAAATSAPAASASPSASSPPATGQSFAEENVYSSERDASVAAVPLLDANGKPLPQTDARPSTASASFIARMHLLGRAISQGDAELALPAFFPKVAYAQVKDIEQPDRDWEHRLVGAFRRDIAEYRKKLGKEAHRALLWEVKVSEASAKLMKPGSEGNRVGYYRVLRSELVFRLPGGLERRLELTSMISWRGEWYVVHLHGFK